MEKKSLSLAGVLPTESKKEMARKRGEEVSLAGTHVSQWKMGALKGSVAFGGTFNFTPLN